MGRHVAEPLPSVAYRLEDLSWFEAIFEKAHASLSATPEEFQPSWWKQHDTASRASSNTREGND